MQKNSLTKFSQQVNRFTRLDLHSHSIFSDGTKNINELLNLAELAKLDYFSITDHDLMDANPVAEMLFKDSKVKYIAGAEISAKWQDKTIHVVALNFQQDNQELISLINEIQSIRKTRVEKILAMLKQQGIDSCKDHLMQGIKSKQAIYPNIEFIGSLEIAKFLAEKKYCKDIPAAYKNYLGKDGLAYYPMALPSLERVVATINNAGGVSVLAHPLRYKISTQQLSNLICDFKNYQGQAIEVITNNKFTKLEAKLCKTAKRLDLYASVGSDFHGHNAKKIGDLYPLPTTAKSIVELLS